MTVPSIYNWHLNKGDEVGIASHLTCYAQGDRHGIVTDISGTAVFVRMTRSSLLRKFDIKHVKKVLPPLQGPLWPTCIGHCMNAPIMHDWEPFDDLYRYLPHIENRDLYQVCMNEGHSACDC